MRRVLVVCMVAAWLVTPAVADPQRIAYATHRDGDWEIYAVRPDGSDPVRLTHHPAADRDPCWSWDGSRLLFSSDRDGTTSIWVLYADGREPELMVSLEVDGHPLRLRHPAWSRNDGRIAFESEVEPGVDIGAVWEMPASPGARAYTVSTFGGAQSPGWGWGCCDLYWVVPIIPEVAEFLSQMVLRDRGHTVMGSMGITIQQAALSPSEAWFALAADGDLWLYSDGLKPLRNLTQPFSPDADDLHPSWSPDGRWLAFESSGHVCVVEVETGAVTRIAEGHDPSWSPDLPPWTAVAPASWGRVKVQVGTGRGDGGRRETDGGNRTPTSSP